MIPRPIFKIERFFGERGQAGLRGRIVADP